MKPATLGLLAVALILSVSLGLERRELNEARATTARATALAERCMEWAEKCKARDARCFCLNDSKCRKEMKP